MNSLLLTHEDVGLVSPQSPASPTLTKGGNPLSAKVSSVLSASYADSEFRESLALLDERGVRSTAETRRQLRLDLQKEVIESNGEIIDEFAKVAQVWPATRLDQVTMRLKHGSNSGELAVQLES